MRWVALITGLLLFSGCTGNFDRTVDLEHADWYYAQGSQDDSVDQAQEYTFTRLDSLINLQDKLPEKEGFIWLKTSFEIPDDSNEYNLFLGRIIMADETYFNGHLIGKTGEFPPDFFSEWNKNRLYPVNRIFVKDENELLIKIYVNAEGGIQGRPGLMERGESASLVARKEFLDSFFNIFIAFLMFMIACYHFLIFVYRPKDRENLYYALLSLLFVVYLHNFFITRLPFFESPPFSYLTFQKIIFSSMFLMIIAMVYFFQSFLDREENRYVHYGLIASCIVPIIIFLIPGDYQTFFNLRFLIVVVFSVPALIYILTVLIISMLKKVESASTLFIGTLPLWFCVLFDIVVHVILKFDDVIYLAGFGLPSFLIVMAGILAKRFVTYHNEVEEYKETLEIKVKERTEELNKRNTELEEAHRIMTRDMVMAENVQKSLFPKENIDDDTWDISYAFKPMAGVSGDMYDFYEENGKLKGVGLFDVSGHGIASGLITLLGKSIIQRHFVNLYDIKLNKVIERINTSLISELGNVDNYLTGILLRIRDNIIEYVNAGHTELLFKSARTGKVRVVNLDGKDVKGMFLGIEGMQSNYTSLQFKMDKGDVLFLYSDCLNESFNSNEEEYSSERIMRVLEETDAVSAQHIRNRMIYDFGKFIWPESEANDLFIKNFLSSKGEYNLKDDFTLIVLKKL